MTRSGERYPRVAVKSTAAFVVRDGRAVRDALLARGGPTESGFVRHAYRPFDTRWLYWEAGHGLLGRPAPRLQAARLRGEPVAFRRSTPSEGSGLSLKRR